MSESIDPLGLYPEPQLGLPAIDTPELATLLDHWLAIKGDLKLPLRSAIDPIALHQALSLMWIYRYDPEQDDFQCELSGNDINTAWKRNITGAWTRELFPGEVSKTLIARWHYICDNGLIMKTDFNMARDLSYKPAERLTLPLTNEDGSKRSIIGITAYSYQKFYEDNKDVAPPDSNPRYYLGRVDDQT